MVQTSVKELGPLNTMVANAGIAQVKSLLDLTPEDFERMFRVNVFGVHNCHSTAAKQLISQGNCTMENPGKQAAMLLCAAHASIPSPFAYTGHFPAHQANSSPLPQS